LCVLPTLAKSNFAITSFDLWLSKGTHDIFAFLINFLGANWQLKHIMLGHFKVVNISYNEKKIISYMKDEDSMRTQWLLYQKQLWIVKI
jgi:hypothetical protein